ncbi:MAG: tandem-95 repeat protein [Chloroflexi bacterium]|nr:tandem-95 repeat protein [Chloroflexota bacterium]
MQALSAGLVLGSVIAAVVIAITSALEEPPNPLPSVSLFKLVDPQVIPSGIARSRDLRVDFQVREFEPSDGVARRWLIREGPGEPPPDDDPGWRSTPPDGFGLSPGDGFKSIELWMKDPDQGVVPAAEFTVLLDTTMPLDPTNAGSPTHLIGIPSNYNRVTARWNPAQDPDPGSGISGYSIDWNRFSNTIPDSVIDLDAAAVQAISPSLTDGNWYLHLSTIDRAGNHTTTVHLGPFVIEGSLGIDRGNEAALVGAGAAASDLTQPLEEPPANAGVDLLPDVPESVPEEGIGVVPDLELEESPVDAPTDPSTIVDDPVDTPDAPAEDAPEEAPDSNPEPEPEPDIPAADDDDDDDGDAGTAPIPAAPPAPTIIPSIVLSLGGDGSRLVGESAAYQFTITNSSSAGTPALILDSLTDDLLGDLTANAISAGCGTLLVGSSCNFSVARQVQSTDANPLVNAAVVHYHPLGLASDATDSASHSITVNNTPPVADNDSGLYRVDENLTLTVAAPGVLSNDNDIDGDSISAVLVAGPNNGAVTLNADGSFVYIPDSNFNGADSFIYQASDGTDLSGTASVAITVHPVNQTPTAVALSITTDQDTTVSVPVTGSDVETSWSDLSLSITIPPASGSLTGSAPALFYIPNPGFWGSDSFSYTVTDRGDPDNCGAAGAGCASAATSSAAVVSIGVLSNVLITDIAAGSGRTYQLGTLAVGERLYTDRSRTFSIVPALLTGQEYIRTAHQDRDRNNANDLTFTLTQDARVYVLYDDRVTTLPAWLDDGSWTLDPITVDTTDGLRRVYHRDFLAGTVQLGGNAMSPMSGARRNYNVVAVP